MPVHKQVRRHRPSPGLPRRLCESAASLSCSHDTTLSEDSNEEEEGSLVQDGFSTDEKISTGMIVKKYFQGHGWCNGKVVSYRNYTYQIQFRISNIATECSAPPAELKRLRSTATIREGASLDIYWPALKVYKQAVVRRESSRKRENFLVSYGDSPAEREWIDLQRHTFRILDGKPPAVEVVVPSSASSSHHARASSPPNVEVAREVSTGSDEGSLHMYRVDSVTMGQAIPDAASSISFSDCAGSNGGTGTSSGMEVPRAFETRQSTLSFTDGIPASSSYDNGNESSVCNSAEVYIESKPAPVSEMKARIEDVETSQIEDPEPLVNDIGRSDDFASVPSSANTSNQSTIPSSNVKSLVVDTTASTKRRRAKSPVDYVAVSPFTRNNLAERRKLKNSENEQDDYDGVLIDPVSDRATRSLVNSLIALGSRVSVYFEDENSFFSGTITDFRARGAPFFISYDDGDEEWIDLRKHKFRILGMGNPRRHSNTPECDDQMTRSGESSKQRKTTKGVNSKETLKVEEEDLPAVELSDEAPEKSSGPKTEEMPAKTLKRKRASISAGSEIPLESKISRLSIGSRIAVWWPDDEHYYIGSVKKERVHKQPFFIVYDDDDEGEWLDLKEHTFKIMPSEPPEQKKRGRRKKDEGGNSGDVGHIQVGSRVAIWWNNVSQYLKGRITKQRNHDKPFYINYDMGQPGHWIDISKYSFRLLDRGSAVSTSSKPPKSPATPKRKRRGSVSSAATDLSSEICVGTRVSVYWEGDDAYFEGVVTREKKSGSKRHFVEYDDGEAAHWIDFKDHWVRILHKSGKAIPQKREKGKVPASEASKRFRPKKLLDDLVKLQVGSRVEIWWAGENCFFRGQISRKSKKAGKFFVTYDDGTDEWVNLRRQEFRLITVDSSDDEASASSVKQASEHEAEPEPEGDMEDKVSDGEEEEEIVKRKAENEFYKYSDFVFGATDEVKSGSRISVWWTAEKRYFDCVVRKIDSSSRKPYFLVYDDGDEEWTDLRKRYFRFLS